MTTVTVWLFIAISAASNNQGTVSVISRHATVEACEATKDRLFIATNVHRIRQSWHGFCIESEVIANDR